MCVLKCYEDRYTRKMKKRENEWEEGKDRHSWMAFPCEIFNKTLAAKVQAPLPFAIAVQAATYLITILSLICSCVPSNVPLLWALALLFRHQEKTGPTEQKYFRQRAIIYNFIIPVWAARECLCICERLCENFKTSRESSVKVYLSCLFCLTEEKILRIRQRCSAHTLLPAHQAAPIQRYKLLQYNSTSCTNTTLQAAPIQIKNTNQYKLQTLQAAPIQLYPHTPHCWSSILLSPH